MMAELFLDFKFCENWKLSNTTRKILSLQGITNVLEKISGEIDRKKEYDSLPADIRNLLEKCLTSNLKDRLLPEEIIEHDAFRENLEYYLYSNPPKNKENLLNLPLDQIYYLWMLAGGDVHAELKKERLIRNEPPILLIPSVVQLDGKALGAKKSQSYLYDDRIAILSLLNLKERLKKIPPIRYFPLIHTPSCPYNYKDGMEKLPLVIRERDTEYQFHRILLFDRMLKGYPSTREMIVKEAQTDIPPFLRGKIWACILDVIPNGSYSGIDKVTQLKLTDKSKLMFQGVTNTMNGHRKLKRLLKAWVTAHPQYVYWQGLDSLTAPFLYLNFNDEEMAFLSLYKFVPKYLQWFFLKDNSAVIKEYLSKFAQLTAYHEPVLSTHLVGINFIPELFAIPWFLTMFSHVFPLHKILHLWDKLMLGDNSYPLFIGISILKQLKPTLLSSGFNECILLFSDLPDIVMENCVLESQEMYETTPKSLSHREHILREEKPGEWDISDVTLEQIQTELCPRISANDFAELLRYSPEKLCSVDLRGALEFSRLYIEGSINIPFTSVSLSEKNLDALGIPDLNQILEGRIVVVYSNLHENCILVFSKFLVECGVPRVCVLHNGFDILHTIVPNILLSK
uniref:Rab-GAP TBC domain-containing protein n=1 Tax=Megaselia scalaris TaxID=36166 RepID=T1GJ66_MEGSC